MFLCQKKDGVNSQHIKSMGSNWGGKFFRCSHDLHVCWRLIMIQSWRSLSRSNPQQAKCFVFGRQETALIRFGTPADLAKLPHFLRQRWAKSDPNKRDMSPVEFYCMPSSSNQRISPIPPQKDVCFCTSQRSGSKLLAVDQNQIPSRSETVRPCR